MANVGSASEVEGELLLDGEAVTLRDEPPLLLFFDYMVIENDNERSVF